MKAIHINGFKAVTFLLLSFVFTAGAQDDFKFERTSIDTIRYYTSLKAALRQPDKVVRLKLRRERYKKMPKEILKFKNLKEINLSKNKIDTIPGWIGSLIKLERIDFSDNKIKIIPPEFKKLKNLERLHLGENYIDSIPKSLASLNKLKLLDIWANPAAFFAPQLQKINDNLKYVDLRAVMLDADEQKFLAEDLWPEVKVFMDRPCDC